MSLLGNRVLLLGNSEYFSDVLFWMNVVRGTVIPFDQDTSVLHVMSNKRGMVAFQFLPVDNTKQSALLALYMANSEDVRY